MLEPKPPWPPSITDESAVGSAHTGANIGNEARLGFEYPNARFLLPPWPDDDELSATAEPLDDYKYPNAWFLLPPWPDDDELSVIAEPPDERRPKPGHELRDGQHHSDRPCTADRNGSTLPSARPC